jgi:hypothetical protein
MDDPRTGRHRAVVSHPTAAVTRVRMPGSFHGQAPRRVRPSTAAASLLLAAARSGSRACVQPSQSVRRCVRRQRHWPGGRPGSRTSPGYTPTSAYRHHRGRGPRGAAHTAALYACTREPSGVIRWANRAGRALQGHADWRVMAASRVAYQRRWYGETRAEHDLCIPTDALLREQRRAIIRQGEHDCGKVRACLSRGTIALFP